MTTITRLSVRPLWRLPEATPQPSLQEARIALRLGCIHEAEFVLNSIPGRVRDAAWLNLMGVVHESRGNWRRARRFYGKAMRADRGFEPAEQNMRRWFELFTYGHTDWPVALGDEAIIE